MNNIQQYELTDGVAILDSKLYIVTADQEVYRFFGISEQMSLIDFIHQVDLDDFMDVVNNLHGEKNTIVLRMHRCDNSYRWMLVCIEQRSYAISGKNHEYYHVELSDILSMKKQNISLENTVTEFRHLFALEHELILTYSFKDDVFKMNSFHHDVPGNHTRVSLEEFYDLVLENQAISDDSMPEFTEFFNDLKQGLVSFSHVWETNFFSPDRQFKQVELRGTTIYQDKVAVKAVVSIRRMNRNKISMNLNDGNDSSAGSSSLLSYQQAREFCENNIAYRSECQFTFLLLEVDRIDGSLAKENNYFDTIWQSILDTIIKVLGEQGIACQLQPNLIFIAVKNINTDIDTRAFLFALRTNIKWNLKAAGMNADHTFSIGVARYPQNGNNLSQVHRKLVRALEIAHSKGCDCYVIYREYLHGNMN